MRILYIFDASDWESRMEVAHKAKALGAEVTIGLINDDKINADKTAKDFKIIPLKRSKNNIGILSSLQMVYDINALIEQENPDIIHAVTLKYGFMAGIAAFPFKNLRKIYTLAGLGYLFRSDEAKSALLRGFLRPFLTAVLRRKNTMLIFQNQDDLDLMIKGKYASRKNTVLIKGSGVYLDRFNPVPSNNNEPIILMPTRLVHEKGISVFIEAARILKARDIGIDAKFQIAGGQTKHNPRAISVDEMQEMVNDGAVEWLGRVENMPELLSKASVIVYPSYYGEGIPRVLLESCAAGRAIVTTDHAGCREAVSHGVNGQLVEIKNPEQTADAIYELLTNPEKRKAMEAQSLRRAKEEFDIYIIAEETTKLYNLPIS